MAKRGRPRTRLTLEEELIAFGDDVIAEWVFNNIKGIPFPVQRAVFHCLSARNIRPPDSLYKLLGVEILPKEMKHGDIRSAGALARRVKPGDDAGSLGGK